jgi:cobalt-zinc-cadmium resistance protein CzcA
MSQRLFEAALKNRLMTILLVVVFVAIGLRAMTLLPIDASPDVTPNVVQIVAEAPGLGAVEVEKLITFPIEVSMRGLAGIAEIRSISRFGLSSVSVYFDEGLDIYFARRLVMERLPSAAAATNHPARRRRFSHGCVLSLLRVAPRWWTRFGLQPSRM